MHKEEAFSHGFSNNYEVWKQTTDVCTRHPRWSLTIKISLQTLMLEQRAKITGNGFLAVMQDHSLMISHLTASLLPPSSQTRGHRVIQRRSRGSALPLAFVMVQYTNGNGMTHPPNTILHAKCVLQGPCTAMGGESRQNYGTSGSSWATSTRSAEAFRSTATAAI